jgi:hypothetical protein
VAPLAVKVAELPEQMDVGVETTRTEMEDAPTITLTVSVLLQPGLVPITEYVVELLGLTCVVPAVEPVDQEYVLAPLTLRVTVAPAQTVPEGFELMERVGVGTTLTVVTLLLVQ